MKQLLSSTPQHTDDNWLRFGEPDSGGDEIVFDPDVDEVISDNYSDSSYEN